MDDFQDLNLCIVIQNPPSPSETFIRAHIERLSSRARVIDASNGPAVDGVPSRSNRPAARAVRKMVRAARGQSWGEELNCWYERLLRRIAPDVVLTEYGSMGVTMMEACRRVGVPLVVHFHGYDASHRPTLEQIGHRYPEMFGVAAGVVTVSNAMRDRLVEMGASPEKVHLNPYGVDCSLFRDADPAAAPPTILAVGRFCEKKAPDLTLRAFALVRRECPKARLRMVGWGPLQQSCIDLAAELGISEAVDFLGACPPQMVREEMRQARCFVQHSKVAPDGDMEGTPVSILEAGASGLPVVSTRHAGIPDVVFDGRTGFLVEEGDYRGMAGHLIRLVQDPALAADVGREARRHVVAEYSMEDRIRRLREIIDSCCRPEGAGLVQSPSIPARGQVDQTRLRS